MVNQLECVSYLVLHLPGKGVFLLMAVIFGLIRDTVGMWPSLSVPP